MVTLTTGIMFLLFICMHFGCEEFHEGGPRVRRKSMKLSAIAEILRSTGLDKQIKYCKFYNNSHNF
jgi:hypothetical protein